MCLHFLKFHVLTFPKSVLYRLKFVEPIYLIVEL